MSVNSIGSGFSALFCFQLHPSFPYIRKNALIFNRPCACVKYNVAKSLSLHVRLYKKEARGSWDRSSGT